MKGNVSMKLITNEKDIANGKAIWINGQPYKMEIEFSDSSKQKEIDRKYGGA